MDCLSVWVHWQKYCDFSKSTRNHFFIQKLLLHRVSNLVRSPQILFTDTICKSYCSVILSHAMLLHSHMHGRGWWVIGDAKPHGSQNVWHAFPFWRNNKGANSFISSVVENDVHFGCVFGPENVQNRQNFSLLLGFCACFRLNRDKLGSSNSHAFWLQQHQAFVHSVSCEVITHPCMLSIYTVMVIAKSLC